MLNPWLAITFQAIRLGFEAQNAMALRMMRLVGDVSKTAAGGMIADKGPPPADARSSDPEGSSRLLDAWARLRALENGQDQDLGAGSIGRGG